MPSATVADVSTSFLPSRYGLAFRNPVAPPGSGLGRKLTSEVCGGMSFVALDHYWAGLSPRPDASVDSFLLMRNAASIAANGARFVAWTLVPDLPSAVVPWGVAEKTRSEELPALAAALRRGPVPLGLVKARRIQDVGRNHQVVAYGMERRGRLAFIRIYDPNQPLADDAFLRVDVGDPDAPILEYGGVTRVAEWRGLFVESYGPVAPPRR